MSRSSTAARTGPYRLNLISASQVKQTECIRRWGFARLMGLREPQGEAAARGTGHHEEMEMWSRYARIPYSKPAIAAMKFAPPPGVAETEVPIRFDTPNSPWIGYIDLAYDWVDDRAQPIASTGWTVIHDWKFTGSLRNAKEPEELLEDAAANLYAWEAFLGGAQRVSGRWVYVQMNGSAATKEVWFHFEYSKVESIVHELDQEAAKLHEMYRAYELGNLRVLDLPTNTTQCYAFKQQCPRFSDCNPQRSFSMTGADTMSADFRESIASTFPGAPSVAPPPLSLVPPIKAPSIPPAIPSAPPLAPPSIAPPAIKPIDARWQQHAADMKGLTPESGFVNPPEAPKVAAVSPEHAAQLQNVTAPAAPVAVSDDLDALDRDQLKGLAVSLGAVPANSRAREQALKEAIRAARAQPAAAPSVPPSIPAAPPAVPSSVPPVVITSLPHPPAVPSLSKTTDTRDFKTFTLYVNCVPANRTDELSLQDIIEHGNAQVQKDFNVNDYRSVDFGKGVPSFLYGAKRFVESCAGVSMIVLDSRTPEGQVLLNTLAAVAGEANVVRGF